MIARYHGKMFDYVENQKNIITGLREKTDSGFQFYIDIYYKNVREDELTDIFDVEFWVEYHTGLSDTPSMWTISDEAGGILNGKVLLRFGAGILPGWEIEEKNVCTKYVPVTDLSHAKVVYSYRKKDGRRLPAIQREELEIPVDKMLELYEGYKRSNL